MIQWFLFYSRPLCFLMLLNNCSFFCSACLLTSYRQFTFMLEWLGCYRLGLDWSRISVQCMLFRSYNECQSISLEVQSSFAVVFAFFCFFLNDWQYMLMPPSPTRVIYYCSCTRLRWGLDERHGVDLTAQQLEVLQSPASLPVILEEWGTVLLQYWLPLYQVVASVLDALACWGKAKTEWNVREQFHRKIQRDLLAPLTPERQGEVAKSMSTS